MGIISKLKSMFGGGDGEGGGPRDAGTSPSIAEEPAGGRDRDEPAAESERAVKGVEPADDEAAAESTTGDREAPDEPATPDASTTSDTASTDVDPAAGEGEPVDDIKGIGAAYAERLAEAGVHSVTDLAGADAEDLAEETGLGAGRIDNWIERAKARSR